jgi:hypothetical protein
MKIILLNLTHTLWICPHYRLPGVCDIVSSPDLQAIKYYPLEELDGFVSGANISIIASPISNDNFNTCTNLNERNVRT